MRCKNNPLHLQCVSRRRLTGKKKEIKKIETRMNVEFWLRINWKTKCEIGVDKHEG
jgi:hypothetical protein